MQKVSIGRTVHIKGETRSFPAVVTDVYADERIDAVIFTRRGTSLAEFGHRMAGFTQVSPVTVAAVNVGPGEERGEWSWPPRSGRAA